MSQIKLYTNNHELYLQGALKFSIVTHSPHQLQIAVIL